MRPGGYRGILDGESTSHMGPKCCNSQEEDESLRIMKMARDSQ